MFLIPQLYIIKTDILNPRATNLTYPSLTFRLKATLEELFGHTPRFMKFEIFSSINSSFQLILAFRRTFKANYSLHSLCRVVKVKIIL